MNITKKRLIVWAAIGFIWSFLSFQGGAQAIIDGKPIIQVLAIAYGTKFNIIKGIGTALIMSVGRYLLWFRTSGEEGEK